MAACSSPMTAGATWKLVSDNREVRQRAFYYTRIYADPKVKDTVYVLNMGFYKSTDGGKTYRQLRPPHGDNHDLWIDPANPLRMIESNDGGGNGIDQRRSDVDRRRVSHRAALSRSRDERHPISRLRRAAG